MAINIFGDNNDNVLSAGSNVDHNIFGLGGNDTLTGLGGNDVLDGGTGNDTMTGGGGNDTYRVDSIGDNVVESGGGNDTVEASISWSLAADIFVENLTLKGADPISATGNGLNNVITGNAGNNWIDGGAGADTMQGGLGNDRYVVDNVGDVVVEAVGAGTEWVYSSVTHTLEANVENMDLTGAGAINGYGNNLANTIFGNSANNVLDGRGGTDALYGGLGNDSYYVDSSLDIASEIFNAGTDKVYSRAANYTLGSNVENMKLLDAFFFQPAGVNGTGNSLANVMEGNALANQLNGMGGNDTMFGYGGNDTLDGGTGNDAMFGGTGNDVFIVDSTLDTVTEFFGEGTDRVNASVSYAITDADVENLTLTGVGNINGTGNASANVLSGNSGNNTLNGLGGIDTMKGGAGNDTYFVDNASDVVVEGAGQGTDSVFASVTETLSLDVENLFLTGAAAINGTGNASANLIVGNFAGNVLIGLAGDDTIIAGGGNDTIQGGTGADTMRGGAGIDTLRAVDNVAFVNDFAEDRFMFDTALNAVTNVDQIANANFTAAGGEGVDDEIVLENAIFANLLSTLGTNLGTLGAAYYFEGTSNGTGAFDPIGIYNNTTTGKLFYNPTFGVAGDSTLFAVVGGGVAGGSAVLSAEEFTLI